MKQSFSIFVINLPIDTKRREAIEARLQQLGATYEIMNGIYGDDPRVLSRYDEKRAIQEHGKPLIFGEKGCAMAHALVYERIVSEHIPYALVLEDDVLLPDNFIDLVEYEIKRRKGWDWLSFDYRYIGVEFLFHWWKASITTIKHNPVSLFYIILKAPYITVLSLYEGVRNWVAHRLPAYAGAKRFYRPLYNAGAYVVTLDAVQKMLPFTSPLRLTADQLPNVVRFKADFNLYGYVPLCVHQNTKEYETQAGKDAEEWSSVVR